MVMTARTPRALRGWWRYSRLTPLPLVSTTVITTTTATASRDAAAGRCQESRDEDEPVTTWVYVDETKRAGYVLAAVTVTDPIAARKAVRGLIVPGRRRVHMNHEHVRHRRIIVSTLTAMPLAVTLYDAARTIRRSSSTRCMPDRAGARPRCH